MDENVDNLDAFDRYQDIIQDVLAGRMEGHKCPYCNKGELEIKFDGSRMYIKCPECGRFFEGMLA